MIQFKKARRKRVFLREALLGIAGSGKSWTALDHATRLSKRFGGRIAAIDTEGVVRIVNENGEEELHSALEKYADDFDFDVFPLEDFRVENYLEAINSAAEAGYKFLVIDSLSHAWAGPGGILEFVDKQAAKNKDNSYVAWRHATPLHNDLVATMLRFPGHLIVTMRVKMGYEMQKNDKGKIAPVKVGLQPIQREGLDYEFDIVCDIDTEHNLVIGKTRCSAIADAVFPKPGEKFAKAVGDWIEGSAVAADQTESDTKAEDERKALAVKVQAWFKGVVDNGVCTMDVKAHRENWLKKWFGATDPKAINDATIDELTAALADLEEKVAADYREQAHSAEIDYKELIGTRDEDILTMSDLRDKILRKPLTGDPTNSIDEASPNTLKKYIAELNKIKKEKAA